MKYNESIRDFFKMGKWQMNLLLGSVTMLIPMVGPIVLSGWLIGGFWGRGKDEEAAGFPEFNFEYFMKYLERGLWPFLVNLVAGLALSLVMAVLWLFLILGMAAFATHPGKGFDAFGFMMIMVIVGVMIVGYMAAMLAYSLVTVPLMLRATLSQDFVQAFNLGFVKGFLARVWKEVVLAFIYMLGMAVVMMVVTVVTCSIGFFPSLVIVMYAWNHLQKQLYSLYLSRGGEAVPLSTKLMDTPPAMSPLAS